MKTHRKSTIVLGILALASAPILTAEASHWLQARRLARLQGQAASLASLWLTYAFGDPTFDPTNESGVVDCRRNQPAPSQVTILTGNFGGTTVRQCSVRAHTPIFIPVVNCIFIDGETDVPCTTDGDCSFIPGECQANGLCRTALPVADKATYCDQNADYHCGLRVVVDGHQLYPAAGENPLMRTISDPTEISTAALTGDPAGIEPEAIAGGQWALIPGLDPGPHTVQVQGGAFGYTGCGGPGGFDLDVTYDLDVGPPHGH